MFSRTKNFKNGKTNTNEKNEMFLFSLSYFVSVGSANREILSLKLKVDI